MVIIPPEQMAYQRTKNINSLHKVSEEIYGNSHEQQLSCFSASRIRYSLFRRVQKIVVC